MGTQRLRQALGRLRQELLPPDGGGLSDGQLLGRFVAGREEAAFAALVRRHGPMVLGVCQRVLGHAQDAEDAFQATFLVLVRKAASVLKRESVPMFLYGVAYRTAARARARAARRRATERQMENMPHPAVSPEEAQDWRPLLDRELDRLSAKYRAPIILCDLEGKTRCQAARQLGLAEGTLSSRLARARRLLARRLAGRGVALAGGALAVALSDDVLVPPALAAATVKAAALAAAGQAAAASPAAVALLKEVMRDMLLSKLKLVVTVVCAGLMLGGGGLVYRAAGQAPAAEKRAEARQLSELEILRREVEILKLQMDLLQQKVRAQEVVLQAQAGQAMASKLLEKATAAPGIAGPENLSKIPYIGKLYQNKDFQPTGEAILKYMIEHDIPLGGEKQPDPLVRVEKALKALRGAKDAEATQVAADEIEKALKVLREQRKKPDNAKPPKPVD